MDPRARTVLSRLLKAGERHDAGKRARAAALTATMLGEYRRLRSLHEKEAFEATLLDAKARGIVALTWDDGGPETGFIERVDLKNPVELARFLGAAPASEVYRKAVAALELARNEFPVLDVVLQRWSALGQVRGLGAADVAVWQDAVRLVTHARAELERNADGIPVRVASTRLFGDSKRIEALTPALDVLLAGTINAEPREPADLWTELGLFREEQPVRLAGRVAIARTRITAVLDEPYTALAATSIVGLANEPPPELLLSVENLTTFHLEARRCCGDPVLLVYTAGTPSPAWRKMYGRLLRTLPNGTPVQHWGDFDEGGFRIAAQISATAKEHGHVLHPRQMHPNDVPIENRRVAKPSTVERMQHFARQAGWAELAVAIGEAGFTAEQEGLH